MLVLFVRVLSVLLFDLVRIVFVLLPRTTVVGCIVVGVDSDVDVTYDSVRCVLDDDVVGITVYAVGGTTGVSMNDDVAVYGVVVFGDGGIVGGYADSVADGDVYTR